MKDLTGNQDGRLGRFHHAVELVQFYWVVFCLAYLVIPDTPGVLISAVVQAETAPIFAILGNGEAGRFYGR